MIDGVDEASVAAAMAAAIRAAAGPGVLAIAAGNYGGKLGKFHFRLHEVLRTTTIRGACRFGPDFASVRRVSALPVDETTARTPSYDVRRSVYPFLIDQASMRAEQHRQATRFMKTARLLIVDTNAATDALYRQALSGLGTSSCFRARDRGRSPAVGRAIVQSADCGSRSSAGQRAGDFARDHEIDADLPVILVEQAPTLATATAGLRLGASDYLTGPLVAADLAAAARRLLGGRRLEAEYELLRRQVERPYSFDDIIGACPAMRKVFETIEQVADSGVDVLVVGETGTGKELVARSIHRRSRRAEGPFVPVDCGAIPENLLESEFFGHEKGAFTGADSRRIGLLEFADHGTFFLDELGELPLVMQAKLLRTLQERKIRRVGGREEIGVDVRIVAATARDLEEMIRQGRFRQDLYYRINVVRIDLPPLRERGDDIGLLAEYLVESLQPRDGPRHPRHHARGVPGPVPIPLARQRSRAAKRDPPRHRAVPRAP